MIIILIGAPGIGKTTLIKKLGECLQCPYLELSWMPEFRIKNGITIPYEEDELIAIENLILVAQNYRKHGHQHVLLSDFRIETVPLLAELIPAEDMLHLILFTNDDTELRNRVIAENRPSAYRNWEHALQVNQTLKSTSSDEGERIDVTGKSVEEIVDYIVIRIN